MLGVSLVAAGVLAIAAAVSVYAESWLTARAWAESGQATRVARQLDAASPLWLEASSVEEQAPTTTPVPVAAPDSVFAVPASPTENAPLADPDDLSVESVEFRFLDPPEPGARARLAVTVRNRSVLPSAGISLAIPADWFASYAVIGTVPAVSDDRLSADGVRLFTFPGPAAGRSAVFELHVTPTEEETGAPAVSVRLVNGVTLGDAAPRTVAPRPRPGPVMSVQIGRLDLRSAVIPVAWEPPPYVVGQIRGTANVSLGNSVLVGHLRGAAGNVFSRLDELRPGDEVITRSRGLDYSFIVSEIATLPDTDQTYMQPTETPRLTLMTCAGAWNPFTRDYPERLWVIAEPPDLAAATIAANAERAAAAAVAATATAAAAPTETPTPEPTATAEAILGSSATAEPTHGSAATAVPRSTLAAPVAGELAPPGGLGNTRPDFDAAYGAPLGETPDRLVVYSRDGTERRVGFTPDPARASFLVVLPPGPVSLDDAARAGRRLIPRDSQPRGVGPEGNQQFVVERFTSATLASVVGGQSEDSASQPGDFAVVYLKTTGGLVNRFAIAPGDDFDSVLARAST